MIHAALELSSAGPDHPGGFVHQMLKYQWDYPLDEFQQAYDAGCRSLILHRPTGAVNIEFVGDKRLKMSLFSRLVLQHDPACVEIIRTAGPFLIEFKRRYPGARIIAYFGTARGWYRQFPATDTGREQAWRMARQAMMPWINSDIVDICFDEAGGLREGDPYGYIIEQTEKVIGEDRRVYVEAWPEPWSTTRNYPSLRLERWQGKWGDQRSDRIGGILWLEGNSVEAFPMWANDYEGWAKYRMGQGFDLAIHPKHVPLLVKDTTGVKGGK